MECVWLKTTTSLTNGINIVNQLEETKFEQFLNRIVVKLKIQDSEIFTESERRKLEIIFKMNEEQLVLAIKTIVYIFKRMLKFIFMPTNLKNDLKFVGLSSDKAESFVKIWSGETRSTLHELGSEDIDKQSSDVNFDWKLNAELSSDYSKRYKIPKAYLLITEKSNTDSMELTHPELYSMFMQFESIQHELDILI